MTLADPPLDAGDPARLEQEVARTADRLRSLSLVRLAAPLADGRSRAGAALSLAQELTDRAAGLADRPLRMLPDLPDRAAGDVLAVCGVDLVDRLREHPDPASCRTAVEDLVALRRLL